MKKLYNYAIVSIFFLLFINCQNETLEQTDTKTASIALAKVWFEQNGDLPLRKNSFIRDEIDWENSFTNEKKLYVPFLASTFSLNKLENDGDKTTSSRPYLVFIKTDSKSYTLNLEVYFSDNFSTLETSEILKLPYIKIDENNQLISNNSNGISSKSAEAPEPVCTYYGVYEHSYDPNTGETETTLIDRIKICSSDWNWENDGGSGGSGGAGSRNTAAQKSEDQITDDKLDPCSKTVLQQLKNLKQSDIANILSKFDSNASSLTINLKTGIVITSDNDAETLPISNFKYDITLSENYTKGVLEGEINSPPTTLSLATTLTHEILHAYFLSVVDEYKVLGSSTICDFPTIYDAYVTQKIPKGASQAQVNAQHELIATNYVNAIASTIQEFDTGSPVTSGFPHQIYMDIAWAGLERTYIFNKNYPNDPKHKNYNDRNRILSRGSIEKYNKPRGNQTPKGKPCKQITDEK